MGKGCLQLVASVFIIGLLAAIAIPKFEEVTKREKDVAVDETPSAKRSEPKTVARKQAKPKDCCAEAGQAERRRIPSQEYF